MFTIVDGTVALDSESTRRGNPRRLDILMAGWDNLKIDIVVSWIMGYDNPEEIPLLRMALERRLVQREIAISGDFADFESLPRFNFKFEHSVIRRIAIFLENTFLEDTKSFVYFETQLHKIFHHLSYMKRRESLFSGEWMDYYKGFEHILGV